MLTYIPFGINEMYNADTNEINVLCTSEMNALNAGKVNALLLLWVLSRTSNIFDLIFPYLGNKRKTSRDIHPFLWF